jgi:hypothetical protein
LSAHGCLDKLDSYDLTAIKKYGRILLEKQKNLQKNETENFKKN